MASQWVKLQPGVHLNVDTGTLLTRGTPDSGVNHYVAFYDGSNYNYVVSLGSFASNSDAIPAADQLAGHLGSFDPATLTEAV